MIADSFAVRYPETAWVGLRINNVIPVDGYDRFAAEWDDPGRASGNFWAYIDARDVGTAYRAALEGTSTGNEVCLIAAADTRAKRGLRELMAEFYDGYDHFATDYEDPQSAVNCAKMKALFGWTPSYTGATRSTLDDRRSGAGVHLELEDVGPVVVAHRVEEPAGGAYRGQVDLGVQDGLLVPGGPGQDLPGGIDDDAVAVFHPAVAVVVGRPHAIAVREVGRDLVDV